MIQLDSMTAARSSHLGVPGDSWGILGLLGVHGALGGSLGLLGASGYYTTSSYTTLSVGLVKRDQAVARQGLHKVLVLSGPIAQA